MVIAIAIIIFAIILGTVIDTLATMPMEAFIAIGMLIVPVVSILFTSRFGLWVMKEEPKTALQWLGATASIGPLNFAVIFGYFSYGELLL